MFAAAIELSENSEEHAEKELPAAKYAFDIYIRDEIKYYIRRGNIKLTLRITDSDYNTPLVFTVG